MKKRKKQQPSGMYVPNQIAYSIILSLLGAAVATYTQLQSVDTRLQVLEIQIDGIIKGE